MKDHSKIKFSVSKFEFEIIRKIADRAEAMCDRHGIEYPRRTLLMDLELVHANCISLDLNRLLNAPDSDFIHDILGIRANWNRDTFEMDNCFWPRTALSQHTVA